MPLKFKCTSCGEELIIRFLKPGEVAKCRNCGVEVVVPVEAQQIEREPPVIRVAKGEGPEPVSAPEVKVVPPFRKALRFTWNVIKANPETAILTVIIFFAVDLATSVPRNAAIYRWGSNPATTILALLLGAIFLAVVGAGLSKIALAFAFYGKARIIDFRASFNQYLKYFVGSLIYALIILLGLVLFIIPGITIAITFQFYGFFILRYDLGLIESFKQSAILTKGHKLNLLGFNIVVFLFALLGTLPFGLGIYITVPISFVALAYVYDILIKEKHFESSHPSIVPVGYSAAADDSKIEGKPKAFPTISQAILVTTGYVVLTTLIFIPFYFIGSVIGYPILDFVPLETLLYLIPLSLLIWFVIRKTKLTIKELLPIKAFNPVLLLPITLVIVGIGIMSSEIDNILSLILPAPDWFNEMFNELRSNVVKYLVIVVIVAPITEEILFRGIIVRGFSRNYAFGKTIIVSALIFGIGHLNPWQAIGAFLIGIILAWIWIETKSLLPCVYAHALLNSLDLILTELLHVKIPGFTRESLGAVGFHPWWLDLIGLALTAIGIWGLHIAFKRNTRKALSPPNSLRRV